jgi:hypothetical protein
MAQQTLTPDEIDKKYGGHSAATGSADLDKKYGGGDTASDSDALTRNQEGVQREVEAHKIPDYYGFGLGNIGHNVKEGAKGLVSGAYEMGKDVLFPQGKTEGERLGYLKKKYITDPSEAETVKAGESLNGDSGWKGKAAAVGHSIASAVPVIGPWAAGVGEQAGTGDVGGAAAKGATEYFGAKYAPKLLPKVNPFEVGRTVGSLGKAEGLHPIEAPAAVGDIQNARTNLAKKVWQPPTPATQVEGIDVPAKPAPGQMRPGAKLAAHGLGVIGGGVAGHALGLPGVGELGGAYFGSSLGPGLMESIFPEPKEWSEARTRNNVFENRAQELEERGKAQEGIDKKADVEARRAKMDQAKAQREAKAKEVADEKAVRRRGGLPLLNENPPPVTAPNVWNGETMFNDLFGKEMQEAEGLRPDEQAPAGPRVTNERLRATPKAKFQGANVNGTGEFVPTNHPQGLEVPKDWLPSRAEMGKPALGGKEIAPPKAPGRSFLPGTDERFPNGFNADTQAVPVETGLHSKIPTGQGSMPKIAAPGEQPFTIANAMGIRWAKTPGLPDISIPNGMADKDIPAYVAEKQALQSKGVPSLKSNGNGTAVAAPQATAVGIAAPPEFEPTLQGGRNAAAEAAKPAGHSQDIISRVKRIVKPGESPTESQMKRQGDLTQVSDEKLKQLVKFGDEAAKIELRRRIKH